MKYFEDNNKYTLYLGDVLEVLKQIPSNSVDMIFTSPPYNLNLSKSSGDFKLKYDNYDDNMSWEEYVIWQVKILNECYRILKQEGQLFYNHKDKYREDVFKTPFEIISNSNFKIRQNIIWYRKKCFNFTTGGFGDNYENIYWVYKQEPTKLKTKHSVIGDVWQINIEKNNDHPAPFPLELPLRAIYSIFDEEEDKVVMDIFNGSGTTGVASLLLNHKYIGIDISENYLQISKKRLDNYISEGKKAQIEIDKHNVNNKYKNKKVTNQISIFD
jgi:site-specific DNA-methyltransferase (adenine-specific)